MRELRIDLPAGLLANPAAVGRCLSGAFAADSCPDRSQVGTLELSSGVGPQTRRLALFNLDPAAGAAMALGATAFGQPLTFEASLRAGGEEPFGLSLTVSHIPASLQARALELTLWGTPGEAAHNAERGDCLNEAEPAFARCKSSIGEPTASPPLAYLTLPTQCGQALSFAASARTWQGAGSSAAAQHPALDDCDTLGFDPHTEGLLSVTKASSSTGFVFRLRNEDTTLANPRARIRSHPGRAVVELPGGVTINPSVGAGLGVCTPAQLAAESAFTPHGAGCPNAAKIGVFSVASPFYTGTLRGAVYLAEPRRNPFGSLLAIYLVAKSAERGILIRAAGELRPDPGDGTLTAVLEGLPQLPYTDLEVNMRSGQRAPLVSPPACGPARTKVTLTPSAQGAPGDTSFTDSQIDSGIDFGPCPDGETPPFAPGVIAGGVNANVGSYTPYFVHLTRRDTEQEITSYSLVLPEGIVGKLAGIPFCREAAIARARASAGFEEIESPSCPAASQVGRTLTGYGVGAALTYAPGRIYLAGPYRGQPLSLVTVNAATVGPFDLGTVVVRSAFSVDPRTAQLAIDSGASDPIPHILAGIPLHLRDVRVYIDRPQFTRNPTGCGASRLVSTLTGSGARFADPTDDSSATVGDHFQLLNCLDLGFRPRLGLRLRGGTRRGAYPGLRAVFRARGGDADLKRIAVTMPPSLFLAQNHIRAVCTRAQFAAEACPPGSVYGRAAARTPLFDEPLRGPVVLRSSDHKLPDLVASLRAGEVRIVLEGRIGPSKRGGIRAFFDGLPDAPLERFAMWLRGGRHGLLVNSVDVCKRRPSAAVKALAHNNRGAIFATELRGRCGRAKQGEEGTREGKPRRRLRGGAGGRVARHHHRQAPPAQAAAHRDGAGRGHRRRADPQHRRRACRRSCASCGSSSTATGASTPAACPSAAPTRSTPPRPHGRSPPAARPWSGAAPSPSTSRWPASSPTRPAGASWSSTAPTGAAPPCSARSTRPSPFPPPSSSPSRSARLRASATGSRWSPRCPARWATGATSPASRCAWGAATATAGRAAASSAPAARRRGASPAPCSPSPAPPSASPAGRS